MAEQVKITELPEALSTQDGDYLIVDNGTVTKKVTKANLLSGYSPSGGGSIDDVRVDGVSVVANRIANISLSGLATEREVLNLNANKENTSNKVTSLYNPNDVTFPTTKVVADKFNSLELGLNSKVDKVTGKQLSSNDYTNEEKLKLATILTDSETSTTKTWSSQKIAEKINDIEISKFPNVTIIGVPTIQQGQISNFSATNYCRFPFIVNFQNRAFTIDFEITTGTNVTQIRHILDSEYGLSFAIRSGHFVLKVSTDGTSWNISEGVGTHDLGTNTTYRVRIAWDLSTIVVSYSTDGGANYIVDITKPLTQQPFPKQMFIGASANQSDWFNGSINLNYAYLTVSDKLIWQGMDDVGLATRMAVDMSNIDEAGINKIKEYSYQGVATQTSNGLMSASDKTKLDGIESGANKYTHPSTHPSSMITGLANVATSGSFLDLSNRPTYLTGGSQTSSSSADGGSNVYTFTKSDGTTSTLTVKNGSKGSKGDTGAAGAPGTPGADGKDGAPGPSGKDGTSVSISSTSVTYQTSTSGTTAPTGTWSTTVPTTSKGQYLWTRTIVNYSNGSSTTSYSVAYQGVDGIGLLPTIVAASGANINVTGTPNVTASTSGNTTTLTFNYLKGAKGDKGDKGDPGTAAPIVSTTVDGLAPKVTNTSNYLKGDGTWSTPTNTTYTFTEGTTNGAFSVTPSGGSATSVKVHGVITDISGKQDKITSTNKLDYSLLSGTPTIPSEVTESTVSGWGFTKNTGTYSKPSTGIPKTDLASAVQTSLGKADTALQSFTETDPVFSASAAHGIKSTDITNWNSKTSNTGTVTSVSVKVNGEVKGTVTTSGTIDLGDIGGGGGDGNVSQNLTHVEPTGYDSYIKTKAPLYVGTDYFYPVTTLDQIVKPNGQRLSTSDLAPLDGSSVMPLNDVSIWFACAGASSYYTTLAQVLADTTLLNSLVSSKNANKYLARCSGWTSTIASNQNAMTAIGASSDCADRLVMSDIWWDALQASAYWNQIFNVSVPTLSSNTSEVFYTSQNSGQEAYKAFDKNGSTKWGSGSSSNARVGYNFGSPMILSRVFYRNDIENNVWGTGTFCIQGTNDFNTFSNLTGTETAAQSNSTNGIFISKNELYKGFGFFIFGNSAGWGTRIAEVDFYGRYINLEDEDKAAFGGVDTNTIIQVGTYATGDHNMETVLTAQDDGWCVKNGSAWNGFGDTYLDGVRIGYNDGVLLFPIKKGQVVKVHSYAGAGTYTVYGVKW